LRRWPLRVAAGLVALLLTYFSAATVGAMMPGAHADLPGGTAYLIGLARGPIHYDFLIPLSPDTRAHFAYAEAAGVPISNADAEWLVLGWGAEGFYTTAGTYSDIHALSVLRAAIGETAVMRLDVAGNVQGVPGLSFMTLSEPQFAALLSAIDASFQQDQTAAPIPLPYDGFTPTDAFFAARGDFHLFHTCNSWVGETLRAAGVPFGIWTPTTQSVSFALGWHQTAP
jgi:uncharacterized protein (TIGR02117 family)